MGMSLISFFQLKKRSSKSKSMRRRRGRKRPILQVLVKPEMIPMELQIEILTRLPAKSLMRFKCVSKQWYSLIHSRYFTNLYLTVASPHRQQPRLYISLINHLHCDSMEICHNPGNSVLVSLSSSIDNSFDKDLTFPGIGGHNMVVLHGLILYIVCRKACIFNPATRQSLTLPAIKSDILAQQASDKHVYYFLGHDPVLDQYKVVCNVVIVSDEYETITSEHWVFILEAGGSWKRIKFDESPHCPTRLGLCINGVIYYLAASYMCRDMVFSFDVRTEEFKMIQAPNAVSEFGEFLGFIEYCGKASILDYTNLREKGLVHLWVLEDGGKWSTKSQVLKSCQMHLVDNNIDLIVEGTTLNGEVIFVPKCSLCYILCYDLQKNDLRKVEIRRISNHGFRISYQYLKIMDKNESIIHLEI